MPFFSLPPDCVEISVAVEELAPHRQKLAELKQQSGWHSPKPVGESGGLPVPRDASHLVWPMFVMAFEPLDHTGLHLVVDEPLYGDWRVTDALRGGDARSVARFEVRRADEDFAGVMGGGRAMKLDIVGRDVVWSLDADGRVTHMYMAETQIEESCVGFPDASGVFRSSDEHPCPDYGQTWHDLVPAFHETVESLYSLHWEGERLVGVDRVEVRDEPLPISPHSICGTDVSDGQRFVRALTQSVELDAPWLPASGDPLQISNYE